MAISTLTSKGQVTIPKSVRDALHLHTGDKLDFIVTGEGEAVLKPVTRRVDEVFGRLQKAGARAVSIEDMDAGIRERLRKGRR